MKVPYTVCEFEADDEIATMARHLNCPVLSYDSDFFIYNVKYIPFNTLEMKPKQILENSDKVHAMECKIYKVEYLVHNFGGLKEELLPLLATLLGNDFVKKKQFKKFFSQLKLQKSKKKKNEQQKSIHALFKWLQNESLDSAIAKILGRMKKKQKDKVFTIISKSINGYHRKHCRSLKYFNISDEESIDQLDMKLPEDTLYNDNNNYDDYEGDREDSENKDCMDENDSEILDNEESDKSDSSDEQNELDDGDDDDLNCIPEWFADGIRLNHIPKPYINLYTHHLHFCSPQAEDYSDKDSFLCALPIIRYAFDILTDFSQESFVYVSRESDCNYQRLFVNREYSISRPLEISYHELSTEQLKQYFYHFLNQKLPLLDLGMIELLPTNSQLFMISLLWWVANCNVPLAHIHSLMMSYIVLEVVDEKTGTFRGHNFFNNKHSKKLEELKKRPSLSTSIEDNLLFNKHKVQYEDCLIAASVLLKHFEIDDSIRKRPKSYDVRKIHSFAQFQCCLQQFNSLNNLCRSPFESTKYSKCYNGTFIYNLALKLENQTEPINFMEQYLKGATSVLMFYKSMSHILNKLMNVMNLTTVKWSHRKRSRRKKNFCNNEDIAFIIEGFESNVVI
ncbi:unnamed protein product [Parnassius apollo]|uniref:(apollo) hypothetical protein n=1 Tax=Parnassius apollo TaxID=110799 RepID=A0A8S3XZ13_PARAO|nr:unnamed protein product [Parnassius apollo]